jgi:hypothetical protein
MSAVAKRTRREREAQGLPEHVTDGGVLGRVAALLAEYNDAPGPWIPGRRDHSAAAKTKEGRSDATS